MYMHNMNYNSRSAYLHVEEDEEEKQEEDDGYDYLAWRWLCWEGQCEVGGDDGSEGIAGEERKGWQMKN